MKKLIILVGPSGSGKSSIERRLVNELNLYKCISHTTRDMRGNEKDGIDYHFVTEQEFKILEQKGNFLETAFFSGNHYGLVKSEVKDSGSVVVVEPNGLKQIQDIKNIDIFSIYINVSVAEAARRMNARGDSIEDLKKRIDNDNIRELVRDVNFDLTVFSDGKSEDEVYQIILSNVNKFLKV